MCKWLKVSIIEAEMGYGKSHLARRLAMHFASVATFKISQALPVFASFKGFADSNKTLEEYVEGIVGKECLGHVRESAGRILLILDGVDEASADQEKSKRKVDEIIATAKGSPMWTLVFTSRPWKALGEICLRARGSQKISHPSAEHWQDNHLPQAGV